jgi:hypothetical protein
VVARIKALPNGPRTTIRIAYFSWWDARGRWIAKTLAAKADTGTKISVVAGQSVARGIKSTLRAHGVSVHPGVYPHGKRIHCKLMMADWTDRVTGPHDAIWTGSDNWANQSFHNEETVLEVDDDATAYAAYVKFFNLLNTR